MNKVLLIGHVADVPETRETSSGRSVTSFTLAIPGDAADAQREDREWLNVVLWDRLSRNHGSHLAEGAYVYVEGRLHTRRWEDAGGHPFFRTEIVATELLRLEK